MAMKCGEKCQDEDGNHSNTGRPSTSLSQYFTRVDNVDSLTPDDFIDRFERFGFLWFKAKGGKNVTKMPTGKQILDFVKNHSSACETSWTLENYSKDSEKLSSTLASSPKITPQKLGDFTGTDIAFYVSTIVHRKGQPDENHCSDKNNMDETRDETIIPSGEQQQVKTSSPAHKSLMEMLPRFDNIFEDIYENGDPFGTWLFLGHHGVSVSAAPPLTKGSTKKKPKRQKRFHDNVSNRNVNEKKSSTLNGRAEHVDEVTHSGTYHIQISGTKTWKIRPHPDSILAEEFELDSESGSLLREIPGAEQEGSDTRSSKIDRCWRIKIDVEEGDVFVLNTKIWYHCTELNYNKDSKSASEWSISIAQDFYLPIPCPRNIRKGDVVYGYYLYDGGENRADREIPDPEIPDEIPRSDNPNCALVEIDVREDCDDDDDDDQLGSENESAYDDDEQSESAAAKIALVSLRDITEGESLTIAFDPHDDQLGNANEQIDPRVISWQYWKKSQIVLRGEDRMPQDIPRSYEPNCQLVEINDGDHGSAAVLALRALVDIPEGGIFCILPDEDEEYEEVEVDLGTGELLDADGGIKKIRK